MFKLTIDDRALIANLSDLEKTQLPFATMLALNDAMFAVRDEWIQQIGTVFDQPNALTRGAVFYRKATKQNLVADVYLGGSSEPGLRQNVGNGTNPSQYLLPQVQGGAREEKPFEHLLRQAGILGTDEFVVPARGFPLDAFGNVPASTVATILSDLSAQRDPAANATAASKAKRARRKDVGKRAVYFESAPGFSASQGRRQHLPRAIFQRTKFTSGSAIRMAFIIVKGAPRYRVRFDHEAFAAKVFHAAFPKAFKIRLAKAVATARIK